MMVLLIIKMDKWNIRGKMECFFVEILLLIVINGYSNDISDDNIAHFCGMRDNSNRKNDKVKITLNIYIK